MAILKTAESLRVGDRIEGMSKYDSTRAVVHTVQDVRPKSDPVLGAVTQVNTAVFNTEDPADPWAEEHHEFFVKPYQKLWILA